MLRTRNGGNWFTGRVLCYLLAASMVFSNISMTAFAADDPQTGSVSEEAASPQNAENTQFSDGGGHEPIENSGFEVTIEPESPTDGASGGSVPGSDSEEPGNEDYIITITQENPEEESGEPGEENSEDLSEIITEEIEEEEEELVSAPAMMGVAGYPYSVDLDVLKDDSSSFASGSSISGNSTSEDSPKVFQYSISPDEVSLVLHTVIKNGTKRVIPASTSYSIEPEGGWDWENGGIAIGEMQYRSTSMVYWNDDPSQVTELRTVYTVEDPSLIEMSIATTDVGGTSIDEGILLKGKGNYGSTALHATMYAMFMREEGGEQIFDWVEVSSSTYYVRIQRGKDGNHKWSIDLDVAQDNSDFFVSGNNVSGNSTSPKSPKQFNYYKTAYGRYLMLQGVLKDHGERVDLEYGDTYYRYEDGSYDPYTDEYDENRYDPYCVESFRLYDYDQEELDIWAMFKSSDTSVVSITVPAVYLGDPYNPHVVREGYNGVRVDAHGEGTAAIDVKLIQRNAQTYEAKEIASTTYYINVKKRNPKPVSRITLSATSLDIDFKPGETQTHTLKVISWSPADGLASVCTWSSSNESVLRVEGEAASATLTPVRAGTSTVTAKMGNVSASCKVTVKVSTTGIRIEDAYGHRILSGSINLDQEKTKQLNAVLTPDGVSNTKVTWQSSNTNVATVSSTGLVTFKKVGNVMITAKAGDKMLTGNGIPVDIEAGVSFTVFRKPSNISVNTSSLEIKKDAAVTLRASVTPSDAAPVAVYWYSMNPEIASISQISGTSTEVKGLSHGTTEIKASVYAAVIGSMMTGNNGPSVSGNFPSGVSGNGAGYTLVATATCKVSVYGDNYTISFDKGDESTDPEKKVTGTMKDITTKRGLSLTIPASSYKRDGYNQSGWRVEEGADDSSGANFTEGTLLPLRSDGTVSLSGNALSGNALVGNDSGLKKVKLAAEWEPATYRISYELNGAESWDDTDAPTKYLYGTGTSLEALKDPTPFPGYEFGGWYLDSGFKEEAKTIDDTTFGDKSVYAKIVQEKGVTIRFERNTPFVYNENGERKTDKEGNPIRAKAGGKEMPVLENVYVGQALPKNTYTAERCVFLGWSTGESQEDYGYEFTSQEDWDSYLYDAREGQYSPEGRRLIKDDVVTEELYKKAAGKDDKTLTLYAVWLRPGHVFQTGFIEYNSNTDLGEMWTCVREITYGKLGVSAAQMPDKTKDAAGHAEAGNRAGYKFEGWYTVKENEKGKPVDQNGNPVERFDDLVYLKRYTSIDKKQHEPLRLYAKYTPYKYKIVFDANPNKGDKIIGKLNAISMVYSDFSEYDPDTGRWSEYTYLPPEAFTTLTSRYGYSLASWRYEETHNGKVYTTDLSTVDDYVILIPKKNNDVIKLKAQWNDDSSNRIPYNITFDCNGGIMSSESHHNYFYEEELDLDALYKPDRKGYQFDGWYVKGADGKPTAKRVRKITKTTYGDLDLIAKWSLKFNIVYHNRFEKTDVAQLVQKNIAYVSGKDLTLKKNVFKKDGYVLDGWEASRSYTDINGQEQTYSYAYGNGERLPFDSDRIINMLEPNPETGILELKLYSRWRDTFNVTFYGSGVNGTILSDEGEIIPFMDRVNKYDPETGAWIGETNNPGGITYSYQSVRLFSAAQKPGYVFQGWYTAKRDAYGNVMTDANGFVRLDKKVTSITKTTFGDLELYPKYAAQKVTIIFKNKPPYATGVKETQKKQTINYGDVKALAKNTFKIKGYRFAGWRTVPEVLYNHNYDWGDGGEYELKQLEAKQYDNAGIFDSKKVPMTYIRNSWDIWGGGSYVEETIYPLYSDLPSDEKTAVIMLEALWEQEEYDIVFAHRDETVNGKKTTLADTPSGVLKDGQITNMESWSDSHLSHLGANANGGKYLYRPKSELPLPKPTRTGYVFLGWYTDKACKKPITAIPMGSTGNKTYYGKWRRIQ